jgi:hypothetical protein
MLKRDAADGSLARDQRPSRLPVEPRPIALLGYVTVDTDVDGYRVTTEIWASVEPGMWTSGGA